MKIIVRMPNWIGDFVMATPLLEDIKKKYPNSFLAVLCKKYLLDLIEKNKFIDTIYFVEDGIKKIADKRFDFGILSTNSFSSAYFFYRAKIKKRIGFSSDCRFFLLHKKLPFPSKRKSQHLTVTYKALLQPLGIEISDSKPKLFLNPYKKEKIEKLLGKKKKIISIASFAAYGDAKCWPLENYYQLSKELIKEGCSVVFLGNKKNRILYSLMIPEVLDLIGKTSLSELMWVIKKSEVVVSNDSGPMHIASALGIPLVALFGSSDPKVTGPCSQGEIICKNVSCSPCFQRTCKKLTCMRKITVVEVLEKIKEKLYAKKDS